MPEKIVIRRQIGVAYRFYSSDSDDIIAAIFNDLRFLNSVSCDLIGQKGKR